MLGLYFIRATSLAMQSWQIREMKAFLFEIIPAFFKYEELIF